MAPAGERLERAVSAGIITAAQAAAIRALGEPAAEVAGATVPRGASPVDAPRDIEARPRLLARIDAATVAFILGAITVVAALLWFLVDRWRWLGPWGVIATCLLYAVLFLGVAHRLRRDGHDLAGALVVLLAILMVAPLVTSVNVLTHWFEPIVGGRCGWPDFLFWHCRGEELVMELALALAALVALRQVRSALFVLPLAGIALRLLFHMADTWAHNGLGEGGSGWVWVAGGSVLAAIAYVTDRRQRGDEDFARWLYAAAVACALPASLLVLGREEPLRHLMLPGAAVAFAAALTLRRVPFVLLGIGWFAAYLVWLADEVFRDTPAFPILLAALGVGMIIATVWVQRNAAMLVRRFGTVTRDGRPRFPGGAALLLAPALVAVLVLPSARRDEAERQRDRRWTERRWARTAARERLRSDSTRRETSAPGDRTMGGALPPPRPRPVRPDSN